MAILGYLPKSKRVLGITFGAHFHGTMTTAKNAVFIGL